MKGETPWNANGSLEKIRPLSDRRRLGASARPRWSAQRRLHAPVRTKFLHGGDILQQDHLPSFRKKDTLNRHLRVGFGREPGGACLCAGSFFFAARLWTGGLRTPSPPREVQPSA